MAAHRTSLIFDTSGLNRLADDQNSTAILECIGLGFRVRVTETNVAEVGANKPERRRQLLNVCRRLQVSGECIGPYHWIIEQMVKLHSTHPGTFCWQRILVRAPELEKEVARPEFLKQRCIADEIRAGFEKANAEFDQLFREAREQFPIPKEERIQVTLADVVEVSQKDGNPHWKLAADIYERYAGSRPTETEMRAFIEVCPPLKALMLSTCLAQFNGSVRDFRLSAPYKDVGRLDLLSAVYLPYCDGFVTDDKSQYNALRDIAKIASLKTKVMRYSDFLKSWLVAP
jgi:hypothetical protein